MIRPVGSKKAAHPSNTTWLYRIAAASTETRTSASGRSPPSHHAIAPDAAAGSCGTVIPAKPPRGIKEIGYGKSIAGPIPGVRQRNSLVDSFGADGGW